MQVSPVLLSCALVIGAAGLAVSDYSNNPPESASAVRAASSYLTDDARTAEDVRLHLDRIGDSGAAKVFYPALARDPASSTRWIDAAEALLATGHPDQARYCYLRAASLAPGDPDTLLALADYYSTAGDRTRAVDYFSRVLRLAHSDSDKVLIHNVFGYYDHLQVRELNLLDQAIPDAQSAHRYLAYLVENKDFSVVRGVWHWMHSRQFDSDADASSYTNYLFTKKQPEAAAEDWAMHYANRKDGYPDRTRVFNGSFEYEPTGSPFDWPVYANQAIRISRDSNIHHDGQYSMRIDFTANDNPDFHNFGQTISLPPGRYRAEAWLRTEKITSAEGIRLRIQNPQSSAPLAETEALSGTSDWTPLSTTFEVSARAAMLQLQLARHRAVRIDNQLTGTVWGDSVTLTRLP